MGDRGNIVIEKDGDLFTAPVFFYTHWSGSNIKERLQEALKIGKERWNDPQYLGRIIFESLINGSKDKVTGFGISTVLCDNGYPLLCVNMSQQIVNLREENDDASGEVIQQWSFAEFVQAKFDEEA